ncbi:hypothetical protein [Nostoc sp.]|uniref:hypothetical protein n=1 Tax=Nostoc sp. TaxID=1180 RepID=UPI002FF866FB
MSGSKPVTLGQGYSTIIWVPEVQESWALPLLHEGITVLLTQLKKRQHNKSSAVKNCQHALYRYGMRSMVAPVL